MLKSDCDTFKEIKSCFRLRIYMRSYWLRNNVHFFNHRHHLRLHGRHPPLHLEAQVCLENLDRQDSREGLQPQPCSLPLCIRWWHLIEFFNVTFFRDRHRDMCSSLNTASQRREKLWGRIFPKLNKWKFKIGPVLTITTYLPWNLTKFGSQGMRVFIFSRKLNFSLTDLNSHLSSISSILRDWGWKAFY